MVRLPPGRLETLEQLRQELDELDAILDSPDIPPELRTFVRKQARAIRDALVRFEINGVTPLQDAISLGIGELVRDQKAIQEAVDKSPEKGRGVISKLKNVYSRVVIVCGDAEKIRKGFEALRLLYDKVLPLVKDMIS